MYVLRAFGIPGIILHVKKYQGTEYILYFKRFVAENTSKTRKTTTMNPNKEGNNKVAITEYK